MVHKRWQATAVAAVLAATFAIAAPVHAAAGAPQRFEATTDLGDIDIKTATARCPDGQTAFGGGAQINQGGGSVILTGIVPDQALTMITARAREMPGHIGAWSVTAYAVCHNAGDRAPELWSTAGTGNSASVACPAGKVAYFSGFELVNPTGSTYVDRLLPLDGLSGAEVGTRGDVPAASTLKAYAICALPLDGVLPQHRRTQSTSAFDATSPKTATAGKPADIFTDFGSWIFSGGGQIDGGTAVHIDAVGPNAALDAARARAVAVPTLSPTGVPVLRATAMAMDAAPTRSAMAPDAAPTRSAPLAVGSDDFAITAYGDCIGSWYSSAG